MNDVNMRQTLKHIFLLLLLSLTIKVYVWKNTLAVNPDALEYIEQAKLIYLGDIEGAKNCGKHYLSLYHFLIPVSYVIFKDWIFAAKAVSFFFATISVIPVYLSFLLISDRKTAFFSSLLFSVNPFLSRMSVEVIKDQMFWFFISLAILFSIFWFKKEKIAYFFLSIIFFLLSSFARIEGLIAFLSSSFLLLFFSKKRNLLFFYLPFFIIPLILLFKPELWKLYFEPRLALISFLKNFSIKSFLKILPHFLGGILYVFSLPFFLFLIAGFKKLRSSLSNPEFKYLLSLSALSITFLILFFCSACYSKRYLSLFFFSSFPLIAPCISTVTENLKKILPQRIGHFLIFFFITASCFSYNLKQRRKNAVIYKEIGEYISEIENGRFVRILSYDRRINLYANRGSLKVSCKGKVLSDISIFQSKDEEIIDYLKKNRIKYILWQSDKWKKEIDEKRYLKLIKEWKKGDKIYKLYIFSHEKISN